MGLGGAVDGFFRDLIGVDSLEGLVRGGVWRGGGGAHAGGGVD